MITRFLTSVSTAFSPFNAKSGKTARNFLAMLPPNARNTMKIDIKQLPRTDAAKPATLALKFSTALLNYPLTHSLLTRIHRGRQRDEP
jgi:large subunit ribosomal protein L53